MASSLPTPLELACLSFLADACVDQRFEHNVILALAVLVGAVLDLHCATVSWCRLFSIAATFALTVSSWTVDGYVSFLVLALLDPTFAPKSQQKHDKRRSLLGQHFAAEFRAAVADDPLFQQADRTERGNRKKYSLDTIYKTMSPEEQTSLDRDGQIGDSVVFALPSLEAYLKRRSPAPPGDAASVEDPRDPEDLAGLQQEGYVTATSDSSAADAASGHTGAAAAYAQRSGTLPDGPDKRAVLKLWRQDMGQIVRVELRREGVSDDVLCNAVQLRLLDLFKAQAPEEIASYYRRAGCEPPPGYDALDVAAIGSEERARGGAAFRNAHYAAEMRAVWEEDQTRDHDARHRIAKRRLRARFNSLELHDQLDWARRWKVGCEGLRSKASWRTQFAEDADDEGETGQQCIEEGPSDEDAVAKPWQDLTKKSAERKERLEELRDAIENAAGGDYAPEDIADALWHALDKDERRVVGARFCHISGTEETWAKLGHSLVQHLSAGASRRFSYPMMVLCLACRDVGLTCKRAAHRFLKVDVWKRQWAESTDVKAADPRLTKCSNGRTNTRKWKAAALRHYLTTHSSPTSQPLAGRGKKRKLLDAGRGVEGSEPLLKQSLTESTNQLWLKAKIDVGRSTMYRNIKEDHEEFKRVCRKLDACEKCTHFDQTLKPGVKKWIVKWRVDLEKAWPGYWSRWDSTWAQKFAVEDKQAAAKFYVTSECMKGLVSYVLSQTKSRGGKCPGPEWKKHSDIRKAESAVLHQLRTSWGGLEDEKCGLIEVLQAFELHFTHRDCAKHFHKQSWDEPEADTLFFHADFKEHVKLPAGPTETGSFWYAGSVLGVTVLTIIVWSAKMPKTYYTFCSDVCEQSSLFVIACLMHLFDIVQLDSFAKMTWWSDVGPHFLSARFLGFWLVHLAETRRKKMQVFFFPPGHGKGPVDGHFGRMTHDKNRAAKKKILAEVKTYVQALQEQADERHRNDPKQPLSVFICFEPAPKKDLPRKILDSKKLRDAEMGMKTSLAYSSEMMSHHVKIFRHPAAGRPHDKTCFAAFAKGADELDDGNDEGDWKRYYRTARPDQMKLKIGSLLRNWRRDKDSGLALGTRRKTLKVRLESMKQQGEQKATNAKALAASRRARMLESSSSGTESSPRSDSSSTEAV
jgi:hypothetical protein